MTSKAALAFINGCVKTYQNVYLAKQGAMCHEYKVCVCVCVKENKKSSPDKKRVKNQKKIPKSTNHFSN